MLEVKEILAERENSYGDYKTNALLSQALKYVMRDSKNWKNLTSDKCESLEMLCVKLARILNGDPNHLDSWQDCVGYLQLVIDNLDSSV